MNPTGTYTGFDKVAMVKQGNDSICYTYGYDHQRISMDEHVGNRHRSKRYVGSCEYITETNSNVTDTQWLTYLTGPTGVYAVVMTKNGSNQTFYILKDNLGSWTTITDDLGNVEQQLSYDAWGNLRNPNTWSGNFTGTSMFDRGFTGHEHLPVFGLVNMNGRMYDPVMSSFLSVDQYVQSPESAQGFNRYAYCMNNPLRYIDPSGWRCIGGIVGYTPNSADYGRDPYAYADSRGLEPRDFGIHPMLPYDSDVTWMEGNEQQPGGNGANEGESTEPSSKNNEEDPPKGVKVHSAEDLSSKAFWHYQFGGKEDYWIDASTIDLHYISQADLKYHNGIATINLYDYFEAEEYAFVLGKISLESKGNDLFEIKPDQYDFNIEWENGWNKRNIATLVSGFLHGPVFDNKPLPTHWMDGKPCYAQPSVYWGGPFYFHFSNYIYIKP